jgi:hypothetical protein
MVVRTAAPVQNATLRFCDIHFPNPKMRSAP